jgi:hypothetical protein
LRNRDVTTKIYEQVVAFLNKHVKPAQRGLLSTSP